MNKTQTGRLSRLFLVCLIGLAVSNVVLVQKVEAAGCVVKLSSVPLSSSIEYGGQVTYQYTIRNVGAAACLGTSFSVLYAGNEKYVSATPLPTAGSHYWYLGKIMPNRSRTISVVIKNVPDTSSQMFGEACASVPNLPDACAASAISLTAGATTVPPTSSGASIQSWIYPGNPACGAKNEYSDGRKIDTLKPEYYIVDPNGTLRFVTETDAGCNGYSAANAADIISHSTSQYATVSGITPNMRALLASSALQNTAINTLVNFAVSSGFTGIELDWEGFSTWTDADYESYKKFVFALQDQLHLKGKKMMIDAPAIANSTYQNYFKFKYEDFVSIDSIAIMAYDYQYDLGAGSPVAPEAWVKNVINWAKSILPVDKIVIGIPAYGYHGTLGAYDITIDTYAQSATYPGFAGRTINSEGEGSWVNGGIYYVTQEPSTLDRKKAFVESLGIKNISVWHLGGNKWFTK